ncbi:DUF3237 domain-containing protein [Nocardia sp. CDC160]|uniref:DUF3237 domain-containing protein n=1 Tax=Nocardia sp. CDC160 TaxID=3112166 RepID=UPI002DBF9189|nr:DUF3237 domain-containing protein [Nocardia sp. CDC160]MEC3917496.1 DUF3237 domain-containing protein [Nocardia sp. CDC160]
MSASATRDGPGVLEGPVRSTLDVEHLMDIELKFQETQIFRTPAAFRLIAVAGTGTFEGPRLRGTIQPGGGDWLTMGKDLICRLDVRATLHTDDAEYIYLTSGGRVALTDSAAMQRYLAGETLRAADMHARTLPVFETGADRYAWLNRTVNVGFAELSLTHITYRVYTIE